MVNGKMKKILIYADTSIGKFVTRTTKNDSYKIELINESNFDKKLDNVSYIVVDADLENINLGKLINTYSKNETKFWAYTNNPSRANILRLYALGFDNIRICPDDINELIKNLINPENIDVNIGDAKNYKQYKKVLVVTDDKIGMELLVNAHKENKLLFTIRTSMNSAIEDIEKDKYDLIIVDFKSPDNEIFEYAEKINTYKLNKNTPYIIISASKDVETRLKSYKSGAYSYIEKPYNIEILKALIQNILEIKELQDSLSTENKLMECMIENSITQPIITDSNFVVLGGGNQHIKINKNEYFFNFFKSKNIQFSEEQIRTFSINTQKTLKFTFNYEQKFYEVIMSKVYGDFGILERYVILIEDITQRLLIEEQKETFIATLTHDLKSPIRAEQTILKQLLAEKFGTINQTQKEILTELITSRETTNRMVNNLLIRYKATSNDIEILPELNSYKNLLEEVLKESMHIIIEKNHKVTMSYLADTDCFIFDKIELKRVLINLLSNAVDYTQKNGEISATITEDNNSIITQITDNGYGIDEKDIDSIFDKNVTLAKKYRKVGSGLGLYISKALITAHGGSINVKSKPKIGTTFTFNIPKNLTAQTKLSEYSQN